MKAIRRRRRMLLRFDLARMPETVDLAAHRLHRSRVVRFGRIRAHAFASGRSVRETAADITARRITLEP